MPSLSFSATRGCCAKPGLPASRCPRKRLGLPLGRSTQRGQRSGRARPGSLRPGVPHPAHEFGARLRTACESDRAASWVPRSLSNSRKPYVMTLPGSKPQAESHSVQHCGSLFVPGAAQVFSAAARKKKEREKDLHCAFHVF